MKKFILTLLAMLVPGAALSEPSLSTSDQELRLVHETIPLKLDIGIPLLSRTGQKTPTQNRFFYDLGVFISKTLLKADEPGEPYEWTGEQLSTFPLDEYKKDFKGDIQTDFEAIFDQSLTLTPHYTEEIIGWANESLDENSEEWVASDLLKPIAESVLSKAKAELTNLIVDAEAKRQCKSVDREFEASAIASPSSSGKVKLAHPNLASTEGSPTYSTYFGLGSKQLGSAVFALIKKDLPDNSTRKEVKKIEALEVNVTGTLTKTFEATDTAKFGGIGNAGASTKLNAEKDGEENIYAKVKVTFVYELTLEADTLIGPLKLAIPKVMVTVPLSSEHAAKVMISER